MPGYTLFSCERKNRAGGGVLLYVRASLHPVVIEKEPINNIDAIFLKVKDTSRNLILGLVYRPPGQSDDVDDKLYELISDISCSNDCVIFGDFNLPVKCWGDSLNSHTGNNLYNCLLESALEQHVHQPTRETHILDIILSTNENLISNVNVGPVFSSSDHRIITFNVKIEADNVKTSNEKIPDYRRADFNKLRTLLNRTNWTDVTSACDINDSWDKFTRILNTAVQSCVPFRHRRTLKESKPKWWNHQIKINLNSKKRAHRKYILSQNQNDKNEYERLRRESKKLIRQSKRNLEIHIANNCKSNPKEFYSYVRKKKVITGNIGPLVDINGRQSENDTEMANTLNNYFASVFTEELSDSPPATPPVENEVTPLSNITITETNILHSIEKLKVNKTPGPDKISPRILKEVKHEITKPLFALFNKSITDGKVPADWKLANVTPIHKKGDKSNPNNYRPISLTSVVCKLMETIIRDKMVTYLEDNSLINSSQHGFRNRRSCLTNLLDFFNDVFKMYDDTRSVDIVYLDFQKAFDKVPHKRLLNKIYTHGIIGNSHKWLKDWLFERKQRVVINGTTSSWRDVMSGVPQGSVLGPILFLIYINDIDEGLMCKVSKFADDTKIATKVTTSHDKEKLQTDIDHLVSWANKWQMKFNVEKCKVLHIGSNNDHVQYSMNGIQLGNVDKEKDLGVIISNDLKPSHHCKEVVKTANKLIGFIGRTFEHKTEKVILTLYNSLVRPNLEYCVQFWSPYYRKDIDKLERVQRRVTKMIPRLRNKPYEERLKELNLFSLSKRRMRGDLIEVFKIFRGFDNLNPNDYFDVDQAGTTRNNGFKIRGKRFNTNEAKHFFFNRVVNAWNALPNNVVASNTVETFKNRLDNYFEVNPRLNYYPTI